MHSLPLAIHMRLALSVQVSKLEIVFYLELILHFMDKMASCQTS